LASVTKLRKHGCFIFLISMRLRTEIFTFSYFYCVSRSRQWQSARSWIAMWGRRQMLRAGGADSEIFPRRMSRLLPTAHICSTFLFTPLPWNFLLSFLHSSSSLIDFKLFATSRALLRMYLGRCNEKNQKYNYCCSLIH
jgi:hypothetical protein